MVSHRILNVSVFLLHVTTAFLPTESFIVGHGQRSRGSHIWGTDSVRGSKTRQILALQQSKTFAEEQFISTALLKNSLFTDISDTSLNELVGAFEKREASKGERIISQGDRCDGGYVYLVRKGRCRVIVDGKVVPEPYGTVGPAAIFGELGIMYDSTRAATIEARSKKVLYYQVPGDIFKDILQTPTESLSNMQVIDEVINQVSGTHALYGGDIILPYKPESTWLWRQYSGTVLKISLIPTLANMLVCAVFVIYARHVTGEPLWSLNVGAPDRSLHFVQHLSLVREIWDIQKNLTTFILTFFVNQGFNFWNKVYQLARDVQGRLSDFNLLIATNVQRNEDGALTAESEKFLDEIASYTRLFHMLMWASKSKRFSALITPEGLKRMESRDLMTAKQLEVLQSSSLSKEQLFTAPLEWMMIRSNRAMADGVLAGDTATKGMLLKQTVSIRSAQRSISDKLDGRMPLAYAHLVQILVDTFVLAAPIALYADLGDYSIFAVGTLTLFYTGLNNLAKIFLDPLNNENYCENSIFMDLGVLVRETNGFSAQWKKAGEKLPF